MYEDASPARALRRLSSTGWLDPADLGPTCVQAEVRRFTRRTWRLPSTVPASSAYHTLSPRLPARAGLSRLMRALAGRFVVVNYAPAAALSRPEGALVRGLTRAAFAGLPSAPWPALPRGSSARWPADSRRAYEDTLAAGWVARHPDAASWVGRARRVAVALSEVEPRLRARPSDGPRQPGAAEAAFGAAADYRVAVLVDTGTRARSSAPLASAGQAVGVVGTTDPPRLWFRGRVLLPDALATEAMDETSRRHWARLTGRLDAPDHYWYPESWARFLEPGRLVGCVSASDVLRSRPGHLSGGLARGQTLPRLGPLGPAIERGLCVPPGYCLVDCTGTLSVAVSVDGD